ncbi:MAG: carboxypeptidase regulatory-like domain-containing protein [Acidimicrobiia bacterium]|nr:carboxypeptidase regulatory-like domain-containing protein [Acidimicrobiia bacterium]
MWLPDRVRWLVWACVCLLWGAWSERPLEAQVGAGVVTGYVVDESGAALPGARVTAVAAATRQVRVTVAGADGFFVMSDVPPGLYDVSFQLNGFAELRLAGVDVRMGESVRLDARLTLGPVSEELSVIADANALRREAPSLGQVVDSRSIVSLPLNGRAFVALSGLVPGVALPPGSLLPRINGGRPRVNEYLFDGISVLQPEPGQVAFLPNVDAIQELRIETNSPPAEFGRFNGGVVNVTTKAGTNALRGTGFEFFRHEALNARNVFAAGDHVKPRFRRDQFGGVAGGPLRKDRVFFFADYQGQRQTIGRAIVSTVPTLLQRQGLFSEASSGRVPVIYDPSTSNGAERTPFPGNRVPVDRWDPVARMLLQRYPLPTGGGTANNYRRVGEERVDQNQMSLRLDHRMTSRDALFGRVTRFSERFLPVTSFADGSGIAQGAPGPQRTRALAVASSYRRVFALTLLHELRVGDTRRAVSRTAVMSDLRESGALGTSGLEGTSRFSNLLPTVAIAGYTPLGSPPNTASDFRTSVSQVADTISWTLGRHAIKAGLDLRWIRLDVVQPPSPAGAFTFSSLFTDRPGDPETGHSLASFVLGQVEQFAIDLQAKPIRNRAHIQEYFLQDEWRISPSVTINGGFRYTLNFPSTEVDNQAAVFNLDTQQLEFLGRDGRSRAARRLHKANVGPRLAVAARPSPRTSVRSAYALIWIDQPGITSPFTTSAFPFIQTVTQRTLDNVAPAFRLAEGPRVSWLPLTEHAGLGQGVFAVDRDLGSGYAQQWHLSAQRELASHVSVEVAYLGSTITRVGIPDSNLNQLRVDQLALGAALLQRVPNPYFGVIPRSSSLGDPMTSVAQLLKPYPAYTTVSLYRHNVGTTRYHGLSGKLEHRLSRGLSFLVSYTRSRLVDDASSVFDTTVASGPVANAPVADAFDRTRERDVSTGDIPHVFVASGTWEIPGGDAQRFPTGGGWRVLFRDWSLTGVFTLQSGVPIAVTQATNHNAFAGFGTQRPNLLRDPQPPADSRSVDRWFDTSAFGTAPAFTLGSASRNPVRGPGFSSLDLALIRRVPFSVGATLEIRVEAFNVTNTPPLGAPHGVFGTPAFGTITTAGDPRVIQLAGKLIF